MRKLAYLLGCVGVMMVSHVNAGGQPTDINYCAKGATALGKEYSIYTVRCSDGSKREITSWDRRRKWCVGTRGKCTADQLKTAKLACKSR